MARWWSRLVFCPHHSLSALSGNLDVTTYYCQVLYPNIGWYGTCRSYIESTTSNHQQTFSPGSQFLKHTLSPYQPTYPGPSFATLNATSLLQSSTENRHAAHPPDALTDHMGSVLGQRFSVVQTARSRRCGRDCERRRAAAPLHQLVSRLPTKQQLIRSVPPVSSSSPTNQ